MSAANIRWGIIGCGDVTEKKSGPALYRANGSELVAVMRRDLAKAEDFARRHGEAANSPIRAYNSVEALLADPEIDAVYIATPPNLHWEQTMLSARAVKHILVEKPMALDAGECDAMIGACREAGVTLHVAYYRRFYPKFTAAKRLLDEGAIGTVVGARLQMCSWSSGGATSVWPGGWRVDPAVSGGGHIVDVGSHRIDMLIHLLGDVAEAAGWADNRLGLHNAENDAALCLRMESGALVSGSFHYHTHPGRDVLEIYGDTGTMSFDPFDGESFTVKRRGVDDMTHTHPTPSPVHLPLVQALVDSYRTGDSAASIVTGVEGAKATRVIDAVLQSFRTRASSAVEAK